MKRNNRGMSLVEIIIVVAILAIVAGGVTMGIGFATRKPADECANKLRAALLGNRTTTMGKLSAELTIYANADGIWVEETIDGTAKNPVKIGSAGVKVTYTAGGNLYDLESTPLTISFNRSSGAFNQQPGGGYCTEIVVSKGSMVRTLTLHYLTGKIELQ